MHLLNLNFICPTLGVHFKMAGFFYNCSRSDRGGIRNEVSSGGRHRRTLCPQGRAVEEAAARGMRPPPIYFAGCQPRVAAITALIVCILFSASSNTSDCSDSKTSSVTSISVILNFLPISLPIFVSRLWNDGKS